MSFVHLHVHTQYSILDGQASIENLFKRAKELGMPALAITDHGNMFGVKEFLKIANTKDKKTGEKPYADIKPIIGCEIYVSKYDHKIKDKEHRQYYHLILLAKNYNGYRNLMKIVSTGHIEGQYYGKPRVSHEVVEKYHEDLICCSACLAGEVPRAIVADDLATAEAAIQWHKNLFGDDYYLEVQYHKTEIPGQSLEVYDNQCKYVPVIFELAKKHGVKVIATNDVHFVNKEDGPAHDRLICLTTNSYVDDPERMRYTQQEYLKSEEEMAELFPDHPEVLENTLEIADKIEVYKIDRDPILPKFAIPEWFLADVDTYLARYSHIIDPGRCDKKGNDRGEEFTWSVAYLCHLCYEGAHERYGETLNEVQAERIEFELKTICTMGFPDYFLIVQDFIAAARAVGTYVGPGRGSAAGSVVAYCLKITNLDPIKYDLLFERFLNPDRINMPDIDIDFDDEGRYGAFKYIEDTYGKDHISHVVTFGTMAAKSSIKDVARISRVSIEESNRLSKMIPDKPIKVKEDGEEKEYKPNLKNCYKYVPELKDELENGTEQNKEVLKYAKELEGSIRQTGVHACAMIIGRGNLTDYIPITLAEDKGTGEMVWTSQYDGHFIEDVGMLKMDFLGLRTLSIIKECQRLIKKRSGEEFDIEKIDIEDPLTYNLYARGDTKSVFQFESPGMKEWLIKLHPDRFADLIAMNALYRPGPMDYIPSFVARKQGTEAITYDLPGMDEYLADTYGVTVYQEQVMLLSRKLAGFTRGEADTLRKAMGKKIKEMLDQLHPKFIEGGKANGHPEETLQKIWTDWEAFAKYAFNKSHATCYAWVSYQTGWLKAHYPSEFQAANLTKNISNMEEIKAIMDDCKAHKIKVLSPDINESEATFSVNAAGDIRFGLGGIKGFGNNIVSALISDRDENGLYADVFDFVERMSGTVNRKALEALVYAGAFDSFGIKRVQFFVEGKSGEPFIDELTRYADLFRKDKAENSFSLFDDMEEMKPQRPEIPEAPREEDSMSLLQKEKELVGMFISAHPLDRYAFQIENFCSHRIPMIQEAIDSCTKPGLTVPVTFGGVVTSVVKSTTRNGSPMMKIAVEDFDGSYELALFGKDVERFLPHLYEHALVYIEAEIKEKYRLRPEEVKEGKRAPYGLRLKKVSQLGNVNEDHLASFTLNLRTEMITPELRRGLLSLVKECKGKTPLVIKLFDQECGYSVDLFSKKFSIEVNNDLVAGLNALGIGYSVDKKG